MDRDDSGVFFGEIFELGNYVKGDIFLRKEFLVFFNVIVVDVLFGYRRVIVVENVSCVRKLGLIELMI